MAVAQLVNTSMLRSGWVSSPCCKWRPEVNNPSYGFEVRLNPCRLCTPLLESAPSEVGKVSMFDRLVEDFCQFDDFCQAFSPHWQARLLNQEAQPAKKRGPQAGLADSEIMTILGLYYSSPFSKFKAFYEGGGFTLLRSAFSQTPPFWRF